MAVLDGDASEIVIRVVYDGPPEAGKTTSLRALSGSLAQASVTPEEDAAGRTQWFDWMEYTGGRYEGCRIRCQVVSVPGQPALAARRRVLLDDADVVVCVADSTPAAWEASVAHLGKLCAELAASPSPAPGVVVQANKRDVPDAVALDDLRASLARERRGIGVVESIAADGTGIREAFVFAVRVALDRVRELISRREMPTGSAAITSADALLARMRATPEPVEDHLASSLLREVLAQEDAASRGDVRATAPASAPLPPDDLVPSGAIWPPVEGRAILYEVSRQALAPRKLSTGDWAAGLGTGWRVVSGKDAIHPSLDHGRAALIQWARLHALSLSMISPRRCVVLADAGDGTWRLWQIVRAEESLRELIARAPHEPRPEQILARLCQAAELLLDAEHRLSRAPCALACDIDSVGVVDAAAVYIGLMPEAGPHDEPAPRREPASVVRAMLAPTIQHELAGRHAELHGALARVPCRSVHADAILEALDGLLR